MENATTAEIIAAWSRMSDLDLLILRKMATSLIGGTGYSEPLDLIHEAFGRCLDGRRNWPTHVHFSVFLGNVMRSVVHAEREQKRRRAGRRVDFDDYLTEIGSGSAPSQEEESIAFEELSLTRKAGDELREQLAGDEGARKVLSGMLAGLSPKEMCESFHMDAHAFEAARKRVMRRAKLIRAH